MVSHYHKAWVSTIFFLLTFSLYAITITAQKDDEVITIDSSIVVMNAAVTDASGKAVHGLNLKQFHVFEDGVEQKIESFDTEETPFAAVILLDTSGSMEERVTLARAAAIQFLAGLRSEDNTAIYNFDSKVNLIQDFSNSHDMIERIFDLKANGMTVLNDAVYRAAEVLSKRPEKRRAIIILSDGGDTFSRKSADKALNAALAVNATIYSVDMSAPDLNPVEKAQNKGALTKFAEKTGGRYVSTPGGVAMRGLYAHRRRAWSSIYHRLPADEYQKKDGGWRSIELRISKPNLTIRTRKGYNAPKDK